MEDAACPQLNLEAGPLGTEILTVCCSQPSTHSLRAGAVLHSAWGSPASSSARESHTSVLHKQVSWSSIYTGLAGDAGQNRMHLRAPLMLTKDLHRYGTGTNTRTVVTRLHGARAMKDETPNRKSDDIGRHESISESSFKLRLLGYERSFKERVVGLSYSDFRII